MVSYCLPFLNLVSSYELSAWAAPFSSCSLRLPILLKFFSHKWPVGLTWGQSWLPLTGFDSCCRLQCRSICLPPSGLSVPSVVTSLTSRLRASWCFPFLPLHRLLPSPHPAEAIAESDGHGPWSILYLYSQAPIWHFRSSVIFNSTSLWAHPLLPKLPPLGLIFLLHASHFILTT